MSCVPDETFYSVLNEVELLEESIDPPERPFDSKYKAAQILSNLIQELSPTANLNQKTNEMFGYANYKLATIHYKTEENSACLKCLNHALESLGEASDGVFVPESLIDSYNHFGMIYFERTNAELAIEYLKKAENVYLVYRSSFPLQVSEGLEALSLKDQKIEKLFTMTNFFLAQTYGLLEDTENSAKYCIATLKRQYETQDYNPLEFSKFCLQITDYYLDTQNFEQALYCLSASATMFRSIEGEDDTITDLEFNIYSYWGKLVSSYLLYHKELRDNNVPYESKANLISFNGLEIDKPEVELRSIQSEEDVKNLFQEALVQLNRAKDHFVLDGYVTEHFAILQEIGMLYDGVIAFMTIPALIVDMYTAKAKLFEPLLNILSPNHYHENVQQIRYTLGEIYERLADIYLNMMEPDEKPSTTTKFNSYALKAITHYENFLKSLEKDGSIPLDLNEGYHQPLFFALFGVAKLCQKYRSESAATTISLYERSKLSYKRIQHFTAALKPDFLPQKEISLCGVMVNLLEESIQKLRNM